MIHWRPGSRRHVDAHGENKYLGELQSRIMEVVWARGCVTVREVLDELAARRDLAYTTVMTVMTRLADQGTLVRERDGKTYRYRAVHTREEFRAAISSTIVNDLIEDFGDVALVQFVEALHRVDPARLARLRASTTDRELSDNDT